MDKNGVITINNWQNGMADSALLGIETLKGVDVFENPGTVRMADRPYNLNYSLTGLAKARVEDTINGGEYILTDTGLYKDGTLIQSGLGTACDLMIYKDYLWVTNMGNNVNLYGPLSTGPSFLGAFKTLTSSGYYHKLIAGRDDIVYITNGNDIASVQDFTAAAPTVMPTGTYTAAALTLQYGFYATTFVELGKWLMIGTQKGSNYDDLSRYKFANIFPWDRTSTSFENPIKINEAGVQAMIADNNKMYIIAGTHGNVYVSDTTNYSLIKQIPWISERPWNATIRIYPNAIAFNQINNLLVGLSTLQGTTNDRNYQPKLGIHEISLTKGYPSQWRYVPSSGGDGSTSQVRIGFINTGTGDNTVFGWADGSTYGVDSTSYKTTTGYTSFIESRLYIIGTRLNQKAFKNLEFTLSKPLTSGQKIRISYRKNVYDDYTVIGTYTYTDLGGVISHTASALTEPCEIIQFKGEFDAASSPLYGTNINLISIRIW